MTTLPRTDPANTSPTADLYEELPYPGDGVVRTTVGRILHCNLQQYAPHLLERNELWIADVGCGTGEATIGLTRLLPSARVVGFDINPASLTRARQLAGRVNSKIQFIQANITQGLRDVCQDAGPPSGQFDIVTSMGVVHHLAEPAVGFKSIREITRSDGFFLGAVYSKMGRWDDIATKLILDRAVPNTLAFGDRARAVRLLNLSSRQSVFRTLKSLRRRFRYGPPFSLQEAVRVYSSRNRVTHVSDTFSNPCEHLFRFEELSGLIHKTGWTFAGLAKKGGMPTTPDEHTSDRNTLAFLRTLPRELLYDYLAYHYGVWMFMFCLKPEADVC